MSRVAKRYSKALFEAAIDQHIIEQVKSDLVQVDELIKVNNQFTSMLFNPLIAAVKKSELMRKIFSGKVEPLLANFLIMLCLKKRADFLPEIITSFFDRVLELEGVISGEVFSSAPLPPRQFEQIREKIVEITGFQVQLTQHINEDLIGGFVVKIQDTVIDLSVKNQLDNLRNKLVFG